MRRITILAHTRSRSRAKRCVSRARAGALAAALLLHAPTVWAQGFLHDLVVVQDTLVVDGGTGFANKAVNCPEGTKILGGGVRTGMGHGLVESAPRSGVLWQGVSRPFGLLGATRELEVTAVCGRAANHAVVQEVSAENSTSPKALFVNCPPGTSALGGGVRTSQPTARVGITSSAPDGNGWTGRADEVDPTNESWDLAVTAICGTVPDRVVVEETSSPTSLNQKTVTATCPPDLVPLSGGAAVFFDVREVLTDLHPVDEGTWSSTAFEPFVHLENWALRTSVICAPEPDAAAIMMGAIATLAAARWRRPSQAATSSGSPSKSRR